MKTKPFAVISILLVVVIIGAFGIGSLVSAGEPDKLVKTYVKGDVETLIQVSGNDVLVSVLGGTNADKISSIYAYYKKSQVPRNAENTCNDVELGKTITFKNMAEKLTGDDSIIVEAVFKDNSIEIIGTIYCSFE